MLDFLITFGIMSLMMSAVTALLLALRRPMRKRFTAGCRYIIWAVVIIRLCIPVGMGFMPELFTVRMTEQPEPAIITQDPSPAPSVPDIPVQTQPDTTVNNVVTEPETQINTPKPQITSPAPDPKPELRLTEDMAVKGILILWLTGVVGFIAVTLIKYLINIKKLTRDLTEPSAELNEIYLSVCSDMGLTRHPRLYINKAASSPMVCGFIRPGVLLPEIELSEDNLRYIIRHELIHYKRGDLWLKLLSMFANALHWFNPLVYMACGVFADETELSCDEMVLGKTELKTRLDYGASMLEIVKNCRTAPNLTTGFNPKKKAVKERFENIIDTAKKRKGILIVVSVILVALIATSIIGCSDTRRYDSITSLDEAMALSDGEFRQYVFENKVFPVYGDEDSEDWKLFYEDEKLVLIHPDGRCFEYGKKELEYPYVHENAYYSADITIYGNTAILAYSVPPSEGEQGRACFVMLDTDNGKISESYSADALDIVKLHGGNAHDLSPFTSKWEGEYYFTSGVDTDAAKQGAYFVYLTMNTSLGNVVCRLEWNSGWTADDCSYELGRYTTDIEFITELEGMDNLDARDWLKRFLEHNVTPDEAEKAFSDITYDGYSALSFGETLICVDDGICDIKIDITDSGYDYISAGIHSFRYTYGSRTPNEFGRYITHSCDKCPDIGIINQSEIQENRLEQGIFTVKINQWRDESVNWKLYYDFDADTLVLEHSDGRRFAYGEDTQGVIKISPTYSFAESFFAQGYIMNDTEGVIFYETEEKDSSLHRVNAIVTDLSNGEVIGSISYNMDEILSAHSMTRDTFKPYEMASRFMGEEFYVGINSYTLYNDSSEAISLHTNISTSYGDLYCVTDYDRHSGTMSGIRANDSTLYDAKFSNDISQAYVLTNSNGEKASAEDIELLKAFLEGDTATLEAKAGYQKGLLDIYSTLEFGEYLIEVSDYGAVLYVDIIKSGIDGIEPGIHEFACGIMRNLEGQRYIYHICEHGSVTTDDYSYTGLVDNLMYMSHRIDVPYGDNYKESDLWGVLSLLYYQYTVYSPEDMTSKAKEVFGIELDLSSYTSESIKEGVQNFGYKKSKIYRYRKLELADDHMTLVFYADYGCTVPAFKMKYPIRTQPSQNPNVTVRDMFFDGPSVKYDDTGKEAICW